LGVGAAVSLFAALVGVRLLIERVLSGWVLAAAALGAAAWMAGQLSSDVWQPLSFAAMLGAGGILRIVAPDVMVDLDQMHLGLGDFVVLVAPVCSGLEGMGLILVLLSGYLFVLRRHFYFPRALALVPIGIAAVWLGNAVRLAGLMLVGAYIDPDVALGGFHSKAGWVLFCAITLAVAALARRSSYFSRDVTAEGDSENPTAAFVVPLMALVGTALVTAMFASPVDSLYGLRLLPAIVLLYAYRRHYLGLVDTPSVRSILVGLLVGALWMATGPRGTLVPSEEPGLGWVLLRLVGSVLVVPLCEELAFRGFLLRRLVSRDFEDVSFRRWTPLALFVSSVVFGVLHERWLAASLAGMVYALLQIRSGRLSDAVAAHSVTNAVIAGASLVTGDWSSWS
jgi:exosortase E/protease (VPEID-CTERM system)